MQAWAALATAFADAGGPVHHGELSFQRILGAGGGVDPGCAIRTDVLC